MPTRFYFSSDQTINYLTPPFSGAWSGTSQATRYKMFTEKRNSPITTGATIDLINTANGKYLDRQYISQPLAREQVISGVCTGYLMVREFNTTDNVDRICCAMRLINNTGGTKAIIIPFNAYGTTAEFVNSTTHRNKQIISNQSLTTATGSVGDRLVLELGYTNTQGATSPQASAKWGESGTDLPLNETQTTDGAGWFDITPNLVFSKGIIQNIFT
jgi:hypothetical protein